MPFSSQHGIGQEKSWGPAHLALAGWWLSSPPGTAQQIRYEGNVHVLARQASGSRNWKKKVTIFQLLLWNDYDSFDSTMWWWQACMHTWSQTERGNRTPSKKQRQQTPGPLLGQPSTPSFLQEMLGEYQKQTLRNWNAYGHITRAILCGHLKGKCRTPWIPPRLNTGLNSLTVTGREPSVWPHCLGTNVDMLGHCSLLSH